MKNYGIEIKNDYWKDQMKIPVWAKDESLLESVSLASLFTNYNDRKQGGMRG